MRDSSFFDRPAQRLEWIRHQAPPRLREGYLRAGVPGAYLPRVRLDVPHLAQEHLSFAVPQCVAMVLSYYGRPRSVEWLAELLRTDDLTGTPGRRLEWLRPWGFQVRFPSELQVFRDGCLDLNDRLGTASMRIVYRWEERWLRWVGAALDEGRPPVLFVDVGRLCPQWRGMGQAHAVVLAGGDGRWAWIHDPGRPDGPVRVGLSTLMDAVLPGQPLAAVISPASAPVRRAPRLRAGRER